MLLLVPPVVDRGFIEADCNPGIHKSLNKSVTRLLICAKGKTTFIQSWCIITYSVRI